MDNSNNIIEQLSNMLNQDESVPDNIKNLINNMMEENSSSTSDNSSSSSSIDFDMILKAKKIAQSMNNKNDPRKTLLTSLKPYLKNDKKDKIDQYIQFLSISKIIETIGPDFFRK